MFSKLLRLPASGQVLIGVYFIDLSLLLLHIIIDSIWFSPVFSPGGGLHSWVWSITQVRVTQALWAQLTLSAVKMVATQVQSRLHIQRCEEIYHRSLPQTPALWLLSPAGSFATPEGRCQVLGVIQSDADSQLHRTDPGWVTHKCSTSLKSSTILSDTSHFASCLCLLAPRQGISTYWKLCKTYFYVWPE